MWYNTERERDMEDFQEIEFVFVEILALFSFVNHFDNLGELVK